MRKQRTAIEKQLKQIDTHIIPDKITQIMKY